METTESEISSRGYRPVQIRETETPAKAELNLLKRCCDRLIEGVDLIKGISEHVQGENLSYCFNSIDLPQVTENQNDLRGRTATGMILDPENPVIRTCKRLKRGINIVQNVAEYVCGEKVKVSVEETDSTSLTTDQRKVMQSYSQMRQGAEVVQKVSRHIAGEVIPCPESGVSPSTSGTNSSEAPVLLKTIRPEISREELMLAYNRLIQGLESVHEVSLHVYKEKDAISNLDHIDHVNSNSQITETTALGSSEPEQNIRNCEGFLNFEQWFSESGGENEVFEELAEHNVEGENTEGVFLNITCACGSVYQLMFAGASVCLPIPLSTIPEGPNTANIPNWISVKKNDSQTEAELQCYTCWREIRISKIGESLFHKLEN